MKSVKKIENEEGFKHTDVQFKEYADDPNNILDAWEHLEEFKNHSNKSNRHFKKDIKFYQDLIN